MKKILILPIVLLSIALSAQKTKNDPEISTYVSQVNRDSLKAHVEKLVSFGTRHTMAQLQIQSGELELQETGCFQNSGIMPGMPMDEWKFTSRIRI